MDAVQSLEYLTLALCGIAGMLVAGTGMMIYLLYRTEKRTYVPRAHRPQHGLRALLNRR